MKPPSVFIATVSEGGLLPTDFLEELLDPKSAIEGLTPESYQLAKGERINEQVNRSWNRLQGCWQNFQKAVADMPLSDATTGVTRDSWLRPLFQELGFGQKLPTARAIEIDGRSYAISHGWNHVPIHLVGSHVDLDHRTPGAIGAAKASPHSLVQQALNSSEEHLWGIVSNGLIFRLLRDNIALTRLAYVEWDLSAIFEGNLYSEFFVLWLVCHQSRFDAERADLCWVEQWKKLAADKDVRALENLRPHVRDALSALGRGLISHRENNVLRQKLRTRDLTRDEFYRQLLRVLYRMLFLFVAEDRGLLHPPSPANGAEGAEALKARRRYREFYSLGRLRGYTLHRAGTPHPDLWQVFQLVTEKLGSDSGCPELALPALGSFLWEAQRSTPDLRGCLVSNREFLTAIHALAFIHVGGVTRSVNFRKLGAEELGSVYEGLLDLDPKMNVDLGTFELQQVAGSERKKTGSYYTHDSLVQSLLDSALNPVMDAAVRGKEGVEAAEALLALKVCDPAVGSGHFLIAAGHRLANRVAAARSGEEQPSPEAVRKALREVIGHCLYGVDIEPMSAELCRVSLWIEAVDPGKPLSFLDHHILVGNSLLGATPALVRRGIPDEAYSPIEGDEKSVCTWMRKINREARDRRQTQLDLSMARTSERLGNLPAALAELERLGDDSVAGVHAKEERYRKLVASAAYEDARLLSDAWCAAFVWPKDRQEHGRELHTEHLRRIEHNPHDLDPWRRNEIQRLARGVYRFFHWHLEFPGVFREPAVGETPDNPQTGWCGGFDVILGNPPWEHVELKEVEWFAARSPAIAAAQNAAERKRMIKALAQENPSLHSAFLEDLRKADGERHIARDSGLYPLCGTGRINTYAIFSELNRRLLNPRGRTGFIVPSGIASDDTTKFFFRDLVEHGSLASLYDFENRDAIFPGVHRSYKFCLLTLAGRAAPEEEAHFVFFALKVEDLRDEFRQFTLNASDFARLNPNTHTCPIFRTRRDAELTKSIYGRVPILWQEDPEKNPWNLEFKQGLFNMASDSHQFRTGAQLEAEGYKLDGNTFSSPFDCYLPLYEAKMLHQFDHRWCTYRDAEETVDLAPDQKANPSFAVQPRYWVRSEIVDSATPHFPEPLHHAVTLGEERSVRRLLMLWAAGQAQNCGDDSSAGRLFSLAPPFDEESQVAGSLLRQDINVWATDLACRLPLTEDDVARITDRNGDVLELARELVTRFSPKWLMGWRDICRSTDERTLIASALPRVAVGHVFPLFFRQMSDSDSLPFLLGNCNSYALDYVVRQKVGGIHITYNLLKQFPVLPPDFYRHPQPWQRPNESFGNWVRERVLELTYTSHDLKAFAEECGWSGPPFAWDESRRAILRAELDAAYLHAYGLNRDDAAYVLSAANFPIIAAKQTGVFPAILAIYDEMAEATRVGASFRTRLSPTPGQR